MPTINYPGTPGTVLYGGMAAPSAGTLITTLQLVNTSGTEQATGFVSPMFGQPFKQGDIPAGEYPQFTLVDDTPCPASIWGVTSWPDGSMKFCCAMIRVPSAVAGSGSVTINVRSGGSAPAASVRAVSDLTAANISTELAGVTNLTGTWTASLNTAITDADDVVLIGDGPAGMVARIGGHFKQSGAAHGQLYCWHYVALLQNAVGGLLGIRYLGRVAQIFGDVTSPTPARRVVNAVLKSGSSTLRAMQGHDLTETVGSNINVPHWSSFFTAGANAKYDFVQGGGSAATDCTIRVLHDNAYFVKPRLLLPIDLTRTVSSWESLDYVPYCKGAIYNRNTGATGNWDYIGLMPTWAVNHLITQSEVDERAVRVTGLATGGWTEFSRRSTTKQIIPVVDARASYAGLGPIETWWRRAGSYTTGFVLPTDNESLWSVDGAHRPSSCYYPYLITGEPQYADMLAEIAASVMAGTAPGIYTANTVTPMSNTRVGSWVGMRDITVGSGGTNYKGAGVMWYDGGTRIQAWLCRDLAQAASILPDIDPAGTQQKLYFDDVLKNAHASVNDLNSKLPQSWRDAGLCAFNASTASSSGGDTVYESPWMVMYLSISMCHQSQLLGTPESIALRSHMAKFISSAEAVGDLSALAEYRWRQFDGDGNLVISADGVLGSKLGTFTFDTATNRCTATGITWTPTNGDKFALSSRLDSDKPFAEATDNRTLYAVNCVGNTFQLALTPGGAPLTVTSNVVVTNIFAQIQDSILNVSGDGVMFQLLYAAARFHEACGDSVVASARALADAKVAAIGGPSVKVSVLPAFPT